MMRRRDVMVLLASAMLGLPRVAAETASKAGRILTLGFSPIDPALRQSFEQGLGEFGYASGTNLDVEYHDAGNRPEILGGLAIDLVGSHPDVLFARGPGALFALKNATSTVPIVAVDLESDPLKAGLVHSLARPGSNITGVFLDLPELGAKQLQLAGEAVPRISRVAVLGDPVFNAAQFEATATAARAIGVELRSLGVRATSDLEHAFQGAQGGQSDAVIVLSSPLVFDRRTRIAKLAIASRLPTVSMFAEFAEAGGLLAYGPSMRAVFRRCGGYVGKILQGAKPDELPVERPAKFDLVVNLKTAKALDLTLPPTLLARADEVIE